MPGLILQAMPSSATDAETLRIGFTVSRKVGDAVVRNRAKRRLRAAARTVLANAPAGHDVVIVGRKDSVHRPFDLLVADLQRASTELGLIREESGA